MADHIISTFGNYDFLGKSLPGTTLVIGTIAFLPENSIPLPQLTESFLVLVSLLFITFLIGTLLGEVVHSVATTTENMIEWIGSNLRKILVFIAEMRGWELKPSDPMVAVQRESSSEDDENQSWFGRRRLEVSRWIYSKYMDGVYLLWSHRKIFSSKTTDKLENTAQMDINPSSLGDTFTEKHMIDKAVNNYKIKEKGDYDSVYSVTVSILSRSDYNRAFRFQARYAFCRGMSIVTLFILLGFVLVISPLPRNIVPDALQYQSYLSGSLTNKEIGIMPVVLFITSIEFAAAASSYKRYYVEYILSEIFALDMEKSESKTQN